MAEVPLLLTSWRDNAANWTRAVREGLIPSRRAGTDAAIVDAILALSPHRVLDAGCGEGWLVRALAERGNEADGFDAEPALIAAAQSASPHARFFVAEMTAPPAGTYDAVVLNFALFAEDLGPALSALAQAGPLVIQTLHPLNDPAYRDGWRTESFAAIPGGEAWTPMPWYFHTLASWFAAVARAGLRVESLQEPRDPATGKPLSLILTIRK